ncbi:metal-sulfur cluster assembly factor [Herbaspirillum sp. AP02]|uniref:metal-sulfur cluster assembly factor n=1 Tax=unclassified Herbaspirillum TaxID=2624150 RepID=UPI0015DB67B9|nr:MULTISPECIES: metal-sulfur cluster assembly factor [unclassified Herbaspirillum]MBG7618888.1 metal-sulfur cluster assembly factor [Herbaspirillum sp. AP02]NZD67310.1 metal-sulfur cluster assembly factor [Herbaspirillum sp. AP21]
MATITDDFVAFPYDGPRELQGPIQQALTRVVDPELSLSIVDVGLIYSVRVVDGVAHVELTMTSPACPLSEVVLDDARAELHKVLPAGHGLDIRLVWEPPWAPTRMSAKARYFMGW